MMKALVVLTAAILVIWGIEIVLGFSIPIQSVPLPGDKSTGGDVEISQDGKIKMKQKETETKSWHQDDEEHTHRRSGGPSGQNGYSNEEYQYDRSNKTDGKETTTKERSTEIDPMNPFGGPHIDETETKEGQETNIADERESKSEQSEDHGQTGPGTYDSESSYNNTKGSQHKETNKYKEQKHSSWGLGDGLQKKEEDTTKSSSRNQSDDNYETSQFQKGETRKEGKRKTRTRSEGSSQQGSKTSSISSTQSKSGEEQNNQSHDEAVGSQDGSTKVPNTFTSLIRKRSIRQSNQHEDQTRYQHFAENRHYNHNIGNNYGNIPNSNYAAHEHFGLANNGHEHANYGGSHAIFEQGHNIQASNSNSNHGHYELEHTGAINGHNGSNNGYYGLATGNDGYNQDYFLGNQANNHKLNNNRRGFGHQRHNLGHNLRHYGPENGGPIGGIPIQGHYVPGINIPLNTYYGHYKHANLPINSPANVNYGHNQENYGLESAQHEFYETGYNNDQNVQPNYGVGHKNFAYQNGQYGFSHGGEHIGYIGHDNYEQDSRGYTNEETHSNSGDQVYEQQHKQINDINKYLHVNGRRTSNEQSNSNVNTAHEDVQNYLKGYGVFALDTKVKETHATEKTNSEEYVKQLLGGLDYHALEDNDTKYLLSTGRYLLVPSEDGTHQYYDKVTGRYLAVRHLKLSNDSETLIVHGNNGVDTSQRYKYGKGVYLGNGIYHLGNGLYKYQNKVISKDILLKIIKTFKYKIILGDDGLPLGHTHGDYPIDLGKGIRYIGAGLYTRLGKIITSDDILDFIQENGFSGIKITKDGFPQAIADGTKGSKYGPEENSPVKLGDDFWYLGNGHYKHKDKIIPSNSVVKYTSSVGIKIPLTIDGLPAQLFAEGYSPQNLGNGLWYLGKGYYRFQGQIITANNITKFLKTLEILSYFSISELGYPVDVADDDDGTASKTNTPDKKGDKGQGVSIADGDNDDTSVTNDDNEGPASETSIPGNKRKGLPIEDGDNDDTSDTNDDQDGIKNNDNDDTGAKTSTSGKKGDKGKGLPIEDADNDDTSDANDDQNDVNKNKHHKNTTKETSILSQKGYKVQGVYLGKSIYCLGPNKYLYHGKIHTAASILKIIQANHYDVVIAPAGLPLGVTHGDYPIDLGEGTSYIGAGLYSHLGKLITSDEILDYIQQNGFTGIKITKDGFPQGIADGTKGSKYGPEENSPVKLGDDFWYLGNGHYKHKDKIIPSSSIVRYTSSVGIKIPLTIDGLPAQLFADAFSPKNLGKGLWYLGKGYYRFQGQIIRADNITKFLKKLGILNYFSISELGYPSDVADDGDGTASETSTPGRKADKGRVVSIADGDNDDTSVTNDDNDGPASETSIPGNKGKGLPIEDGDNDETSDTNDDQDGVKNNDNDNSDAKTSTSGKKESKGTDLPIEDGDNDDASDINDEKSDVKKNKTQTVPVSTTPSTTPNTTQPADTEYDDYDYNQDLNDDYNSTAHQAIQNTTNSTLKQIDLGHGITYLGNNTYKYLNHVIAADYMPGLLKILKLHIHLPHMDERKGIKASDKICRQHIGHGIYKCNNETYKYKNRTIQKDEFDDFLKILNLKRVPNKPHMLIGNAPSDTEDKKYLAQIDELITNNKHSTTKGTTDKSTENINKSNISDENTQDDLNNSENDKICTKHMGHQIYDCSNGSYRYKNRTIQKDKFDDFLKILGLKRSPQQPSKVIGDSPDSTKTKKHLEDINKLISKNKDNGTEETKGTTEKTSYSSDKTTKKTTNNNEKTTENTSNTNEKTTKNTSNTNEKTTKNTRNTNEKTTENTSNTNERTTKDTSSTNEKIIEDTSKTNEKTTEDISKKTTENTSNANENASEKTYNANTKVTETQTNKTKSDSGNTQDDIKNDLDSSRSKETCTKYIGHGIYKCSNGTYKYKNRIILKQHFNEFLKILNLKRSKKKPHKVVRKGPRDVNKEESLSKIDKLIGNTKINSSGHSNETNEKSAKTKRETKTANNTQGNKDESLSKIGKIIGKTKNNSSEESNENDEEIAKTNQGTKTINNTQDNTNENKKNVTNKGDCAKYIGNDIYECSNGTYLYKNRTINKEKFGDFLKTLKLKRSPTQPDKIIEDTPKDTENDKNLEDINKVPTKNNKTEDSITKTTTVLDKNTTLTTEKLTDDKNDSEEKEQDEQKPGKGKDGKASEGEDSDDNSGPRDKNNEGCRHLGYSIYACKDSTYRYKNRIIYEYQFDEFLEILNLKRLRNKSSIIIGTLNKNEKECLIKIDVLLKKKSNTAEKASTSNSTETNESDEKSQKPLTENDNIEYKENYKNNKDCNKHLGHGIYACNNGTYIYKKRVIYKEHFEAFLKILNLKRSSKGSDEVTGKGPDDADNDKYLTIIDELITKKSNKTTEASKSESKAETKTTTENKGISKHSANAESEEKGQKQTSSDSKTDKSSSTVIDKNSKNDGNENEEQTKSNNTNNDNNSAGNDENTTKDRKCTKHLGHNIYDCGDGSYEYKTRIIYKYNFEEFLKILNLTLSSDGNNTIIGTIDDSQEKEYLKQIDILIKKKRTTEDVDDSKNKNDSKKSSKKQDKRKRHGKVKKQSTHTASESENSFDSKTVNKSENDSIHQKTEASKNESQSDSSASRTEIQKKDGKSTSQVVKQNAAANQASKTANSSTEEIQDSNGHVSKTSSSAESRKKAAQTSSSSSSKKKDSSGEVVEESSSTSSSSNSSSSSSSSSTTYDEEY